MFQIVVDTDTAPATPNYFADLEKTVPAPSVIPLVQGFRGKVRVYFVGEHIPAETAGLALYVRPMNQKGKAVETAVASQQSDDDGNVFYDIDLVADTTALEVAIGARENVVMRGGLVAYDASVNPPTQIEWQMDLGVSASALGYGQTPPIPPNALEEHNLNESSHPFLLEKIRVVETEVSENYSELKTEISELEETVSANNSELKTEISELAGTVASNYSELSELAGTVASNHSELKTELSELAGTVATEISEITSELSVLEQTVSMNKSELKTEISEIASELSALETELSENYSELKTEVSELAGTVASNYSELKTEISEVDSEVSVIKSNYVTTDTDQEITGAKTFSAYDTQFGKVIGLGHGIQFDCASAVIWVRHNTIELPFDSGTVALTKNITTCTTAVKSELQSELDVISGDMDCFGRLSATNTWTGTNSFTHDVSLGGNMNFLSDLQIYLCNYSYQFTLPKASGTLALTSDIPDTSGFATFAGDNTFSGNNTFGGAVEIKCYFELSALSPTIIARDKSFTFPSTSGTLALTSDIPDTSAFATLAGYNTFTGVNTFRSGVIVDCGFVLQAADPSISAKGKSFKFPDTGGTFALTSDIPSDIPDTSDFATLSGDNTWTGYNTFNHFVIINGMSIDSVSLYFPAIGIFYTCSCKYTINLPKASGTLVVDSQLTSLTSNLSAICKTTVANYSTITPTAGTLYFLTNS